MRPDQRALAEAEAGLVGGAERFNGERRRVRRRWLLLVGGLVVIGAFTWLVGWSPYLRAASVAVDGVSGAEAAAVEALVRPALGTPLVRLDTGALAESVRGRVSIEDATVTRDWPSTIRVEVVPRTPAIALRNPKGQLEVADRHGIVFSTVTSPPKGVPLVVASGATATSPEAARTALAVVSALPDPLAKTVTRIEVTSANLVTLQVGSVSVTWGDGSQGERKARVLTALLRTKPRPVHIDVSAPNTPVTR